MSAWHSLLRVFWALKWPLLAELLLVVFWMVVLENAVGLIQREVFSPHFPYQPCRACRNQQQNYPM